MPRPPARRSSRARERLEGAARAAGPALLLAFSRAARAALLAACGALGSGCGPEGGARAPASLGRCERLSFVPAGQLTLQLSGRGAVTFEVREALLVDSFEVTRAEWLAFQRGLGGALDPDLAAHAATWSGTSGDWPAAFMTQPEAASFAAALGMRLPTAAEWLFIASGPQGLPFPWGATDQRSVANTLELGLHRPVPVGTFEAGRTPQRVYDLVGNVAEWCADLSPSRDSLPGDERVSALGGSFRNRSRPIFDPRLVEGQNELQARALPPNSRADDLGFRCCAEAAGYLMEQLPGGPLDEQQRSRWEAVGRRWGRRALPLLLELAARPGASPALGALADGARL